MEGINNDQAVYLTGYYIAENNLAASLKKLINSPQSIGKIDSDKAIHWIENKLSITLADKQIEAVKSAADAKVMIITGGPGTGKTTIINAIIKIFSAIKAKIMLAAPTGRAAKRMSELTGNEAKTIHRMLEYNMRKGSFQKNEGSPLDCQLLILDEASMVDTFLMHHLLKAILVTSTFIMVGDVSQIPSVGAGNVLKDIIDSGVAPVLKLNEIFRQAKESSIIINAHKINEVKIPNLTAFQDKIDDFYFIEQEDFSDLDELIHTYAVSIHKSQGSEYPAVVMPIMIQHYLLLQRNLLYTGVTKGKKLVVIVGAKKAMAIAVRNDKSEKRYTLLRQRLSQQ